MGWGFLAKNEPVLVQCILAPGFMFSLVGGTACRWIVMQFSFQYGSAEAFPVVFGIDQVHMPDLVYNVRGRSAPGQHTAEISEFFVFGYCLCGKVRIPVIFFGQFAREGKDYAWLIQAEFVDPLPERCVRAGTVPDFRILMYLFHVV